MSGDDLISLGRAVDTGTLGAQPVSLRDISLVLGEDCGSGHLSSTSSSGWVPGPLDPPARKHPLSAAGWAGQGQAGGTGCAGRYRVGMWVRGGQMFELFEKNRNLGFRYEI